MGLPKGAVEVRGVTKGFRVHERKRHFLTLKSTMIKDLWEWRKHQAELFWALNGVDLEIPPGETLGIIGANGSGKSTLLKIIAGILRPTAGTMDRAGRLSALIELGAGFHPEISGRENVFINGIMLGLTKAEIHRRFKDIVAFSELEEFIDYPVKTYSSGMFMRLGFAVAIHVNPDILIVDEVLAVGDQAFVFKCLDRIYDFKRRGRTIIMVTHDLGAVEKLCDRAILLDDGRIEDQGRPRPVVGHYLMAVAEKEGERFLSANVQVQEAIDQAASGSSAESLPEEPGESEPEAPTMNGTHRWGNRKVAIQHVRALNSAGEERYVFETGEEVTIQIDFNAPELVDDVAFGIAFFTPHDVWVYGTNTDIEHLGVDSVEGRGRVTVRFPSMALIPGTYLMDVAVHSKEGTPYDFRSRLHRLAFRSKIKDDGIYRPTHRWEFSPEVILKPTPPVPDNSSE